ncbi:ribose-phosphate diphosphokinase, partial [Pseudomonadota bacterium]
SNALVLGFPEYRDQTQRLASHIGLPYRDVELHQFPDGESKIRLPDQLPQKVIICRSLNNPNDKLVELALTSATARNLGASELILIAPYLCYMRQDKAFNPGEAVSQQIIGRQLAQWFDAVVTVDPHLHRIHKLSEALPNTITTTLTATKPIADFLSKTYTNPLLIGPDEESEQWVAAVAQMQGLEYMIGQKQRLDDYTVKITLPESGCISRHLILLDDVASTGRTLEATALALQAYKPASISAVVTHALFVNDALERLKKAGVDQVWSTDSIPHPTNAISLAELMGEALECK